jgi:acetyltransferase-like isoleucine patch superfamily enzyme
VSIGNWVKQRQSPLQVTAYGVAKKLLRAQFPNIPLVHWALAGERRFRKGVLRHVIAKVYYTPLLRRAARSVGRGLVLYEDMPKIFGNLAIELGENVTLSGSQVWYACGDARQKILRIGSNSYVGFGTEIFSGCEVTIGNYVLIANYVLMNGYDGHPLDPVARVTGQPVGEGGYGAIRIEDYAWIGSRAIILENVTVGRGAVVATGAVVTKDVDALTIVGGNPARVIGQIEKPKEWGGV